MTACHLFMQDYTGPLMIALQYNDMFDLDSISTSTDTDALPKGRAFSFIKAGQVISMHGQFQRKFMLVYYFQMLALNEGCANSE